MADHLLSRLPSRDVSFIRIRKSSICRSSATDTAEKVVGNRTVNHLLFNPQKQLTSILLVLAILAVHFHANSEQIFCNPSIVCIKAMKVCNYTI